MCTVARQPFTHTQQPAANMSWRVWMDILALELYFSFPFSKYYIRIHERDDCSDFGNYNYSWEIISEKRDKYQPNNYTNIFNIPITERHFYGCLPYGLSQRRLLVFADAIPWL